MTLDQLREVARRKGVHSAKFDHLMQVFGEAHGARIVEDLIRQKEVGSMGTKERGAKGLMARAKAWTPIPAPKFDVFLGREVKEFTRTSLGEAIMNLADRLELGGLDLDMLRKLLPDDQALYDFLALELLIGAQGGVIEGMQS